MNDAQLDGIVSRPVSTIEEMREIDQLLLNKDGLSIEYN
jgi:hypothetical protein